MFIHFFFFFIFFFSVFGEYSVLSLLFLALWPPNRFIWLPWSLWCSYYLVDLDTYKKQKKMKHTLPKGWNSKHQMLRAHFLERCKSSAGILAAAWADLLWSIGCGHCGLQLAAYIVTWHLNWSCSNNPRSLASNLSWDCIAIWSFLLCGENDVASMIWIKIWRCMICFFSLFTFLYLHKTLRRCYDPLVYFALKSGHVDKIFSMNVCCSVLQCNLVLIL